MYDDLVKMLAAPVGQSLKKVHRFLSDFSKTQAAAGQEMQENQTVRFGPCEFEPYNAQLRRGTTVLPLTRKACEVLQYLVAYPGQLVTKDALFAAVWPETVVSEGVLANGAILHGWALAHQGEAQEGLEQLHQGMMARRATGAALARPYFLSLLVEAHGATGQPEAGLTALTEAFTLVETSGECWYVPELYRLKGTLLLQQSPDHHGEAEVCFHHAIRIAQSQQAKSWELRAATSLARLWQQQGKRTEARELLAPIYDWFTEGFDTADLQEARALLEALS